MLPTLSTRRMSFPAFPLPTTVRQDFDELFNRFFGDFPGTTNMTRGWVVPVAIWDDDQHVFIEIEVPGLNQNDIEVVVHQGNLRIVGERKAPSGTANYWHNDRMYGRFERVITLPDVVDPDSIEATMHDGILAVTLLKRPDAQPKKVAIKAISD
ncbi:MAG: Hsp20/alpha crystallin family protein [Planctomycetes bacterium]|nr:Hsp20/alpha crystallin family protein [Planctomycetota bacterium]